MIVKENCNLAEYTTIRIGGICRKMYFPENYNELIDITKNVPNCKILSGGSNLLINDSKIIQNVICLRNYEKNHITFLDSGEVIVSSGVRLQKFIKEINANGYGGIEYLYSVPGLVGGAIYMNAGRGRGANQQISDYIISVDLLDNGEIKHYTKEQCEFDYRYSVFQKSQGIIISAVFRFDRITPEIGLKKQQERIALCKKYQDNSFPNLGTCLCLYDSRIMKFLQCVSSKKMNGVHFSKKTANWLQNRGNGSFSQAIRQINRAVRLHRLFNKGYRLEYSIWDD